jgi:hypothetical protein
MVASVQCIASYHSGAVVVGSALGSTITAGLTTINIPATQAGDFILAFGSDQSATLPVPSAGWNTVTSYGSPNGARITLVVSQVTDGAAQTLSFQGQGDTTVPNTRYSGAIIFRSATGVGNINAVGTNSQGATFTAAAMTLNHPPSITVVFSYYAGILSTTIANATISNGMIYTSSDTTFAGGTATEAVNSYLNYSTIEVY